MHRVLRGRVFPVIPPYHQLWIHDGQTSISFPISQGWTVCGSIPQYQFYFCQSPKGVEFVAPPYESKNRQGEGPRSVLCISTAVGVLNPYSCDKQGFHKNLARHFRDTWRYPRRNLGLGSVSSSAVFLSALVSWETNLLLGNC